MIRTKTAAAAALLLLGACAVPDVAPTPARVAVDAPSPAAATITATDMYNRVSILSADSMRGRDTPSPGLEMAAAYLVREYRRLGLEPGGDSATFYQRYPLRSFALDTATVHFGTVLANASANEMLTYGTDFYAAPGAVGRAGADMGHGKLVLVGTLGDGGLPDGDYRGTIPVINVPGGYSAEWRSKVRRARDAARRAGTNAVVVVVDSAFPPNTFAALSRSARAPQLAVADDSAIAVFYLTDRAFRKVAARTTSGMRVAGAGAPLALEGVEAHFAANARVLQQSRPPHVAAILRGSDPVLRDEYVVLSAHMDHVGVGRPVRGDSIYNGADDDASGTSALVEVAEAMASLPERPKRSVIFLHVSGEEKGLLGSRWYSDHPTVPLHRIIANVNVDMIGRNSPDTVVVIGKNYSSLGRTANSVQARHPELGLTLADDMWPEERFFFRSDHYNFARKEIPSIFFFSGVHADYHQPSDEVDKLNVDKAARIARTIFYTVEAVANDPERPQWLPRGLSEVRALTR
ncbi:MAG: M20/M25/M40 family metallo-hydrolase [Gemmatimonadetes bacterium]|nr:M20/M25/M40 family metallo-hydrolase [Gemmatimonadota bacterium]